MSPPARPNRSRADRENVAALSRSAATRALQRRAESARREEEANRYVLRLYVAGTTRASSRAIERVRSFCEENLSGRYELEVVDIYQLPALAKDDQIIATPTLIKVLPAPLRRFLGDLSRAETVLFGMDLRPRR